MTDAMWSAYADSHPERTGGIRVSLGFLPEKRDPGNALTIEQMQQLAYIAAPINGPINPARTCIDCHLPYSEGETGDGDQASDQRCHYCAELLRLRDQALNRSYVRQKRATATMEKVFWSALFVLVVLFLVWFGWS